MGLPSHAQNAVRWLVIGRSSLNHTQALHPFEDDYYDTTDHMWQSRVEKNIIPLRISLTVLNFHGLGSYALCKLVSTHEFTQCIEPRP